MSESLALVAGMTRSGVIGKGNSLPWHISEDLENFKKLTEGQTVVMGRNTYESIGQPLPGRKNVVINKEVVNIDGVDVRTSIPEAISKAKSYGRKVFIIGGASIYAQTIDMVDVMYISYMKKEYEGDVYFPRFKESDWEQVSRKEFSDFIFVMYKRKA